jgi:general secretion pathway protein H
VRVAAGLNVTQAGFTLIEMIVVLAVLGLVAGLVLSRGPPRSAALEMRAAANAVAQTLRVARTRAIMSNQRVMVALDPRTATLRVGVGAPRSLPAGVTMSVITTADLASTGAGTAGPAGIAFLPDGSSSGGRVELATGTRHMQVGVDWLTGRVSIADGP